MNETPIEQPMTMTEAEWNALGVDEQGCNWCAYGLFSGPFFVVRESGNKTPVFAFDIQATRDLVADAVPASGG